jgi:hypothetical protein
VENNNEKYLTCGEITPFVSAIVWYFTILAVLTGRLGEPNLEFYWLASS